MVTLVSFGSFSVVEKMSDYKLSFFVSNIPECQPAMHYLRVSSFEDVFYALFILRQSFSFRIWAKQ